MTGIDVLELLVYLTVLIVLAVPLGAFIAGVWEGQTTFLAPIERLFYRAAGTGEDREQTWKEYALAFVSFHGVSLVAVYALQRCQGLLPLNPAGLAPPAPEVSLNTAVSFVTNTNWQSYAGETTMSYLTQMAALTVQSFVSAGSGLAVLCAFLRGFTRARSDTIGNFWVDLTRTTLYVLLPLSLLVALFLVSEGVVQTFGPYVSAELVDPFEDHATQLLALGPVASQVAIKQLGTNGGGFFNVNSAHPFENPTPLSNFVEMISILVVPAALPFTAGRLVKDRRQGRALFAAMLVVFVPLVIGCIAAEQAGTPLTAGPNMEGKEVRFGIGASSTWAAATTAASNGSVNAMHDSFTPLGGLVPMWLMQLGEVIFGGVGSGLYGLLVFAIVAVFIAGLMVGRTPEYLGKKIEAFEMKMSSLVILVPCATVLLGTALAMMVPEGTSALASPGPHGFSEALYAFSSMGNNNGSAFSGLTSSGPFYAITGSVAMWLARVFLVVPVLAIAGSLAKKKTVPASAGTLPTHGPLFVALLVGTVILVGALTFLPALALGPIVEQLQMTGGAP